MYTTDLTVAFMGEFEVFIVVILSLPQISCRPQNTSFKLQVFFQVWIKTGSIPREEMQ